MNSLQADNYRGSST